MIDKSAAKMALTELRQDIKIMVWLAFIVVAVMFVGALSGLLTTIILQTCFDVSVEAARDISRIVMGVTGLLTTLFLVEYDIARRIYNA